MKKGNFIAIFLVTLIVLVIIGSLDYEDGNFRITGFALPPIEDTCPCGDGTGTNLCASNKPFYCKLNIDTGTCSLVQNCDKCGCPDEMVCSIDGTGLCNTGGIRGPGGNGEGDDPEYPSLRLCDNKNDCFDREVCIISEGKTIGICYSSQPKDMVCDADYLKCVVDVVDCRNTQANCRNGYICKEVSVGFGECVQNERCEEDGSLIDTCSSFTQGMKCQYSTTINSGKLIPNCQECKTCGEGYNCSGDGNCVKTNVVIKKKDCEGSECEVIYSPEKIENYCEYVGGLCEKGCNKNYYELIGKEYSDLTNDCKQIDNSYKCCYPYSNDNVNDCEYYNGTCLSECGENYYYASIPYLDDECGFYANEGDKCCIQYGGGETSVSIETGKEEKSSWTNVLFGGNEEMMNGENKARFSEYISLNRDIVFVGILIFMIVVGSIISFSLHFRGKKRLKRKKK